VDGGAAGYVSGVPDPARAARVLADLAVTIADGGNALTHLAGLRDQGKLFGPLASEPTAWRAVARVDEAHLVRLRAVRAAARERAWATAAAGSCGLTGTGPGPDTSRTRSTGSAPLHGQPAFPPTARQELEPHRPVSRVLGMTPAQVRRDPTSNTNQALPIIVP
jgi:hypothetical protein